MEKQFPFMRYASYVLGAAAATEVLAYFYSKYLLKVEKEICDTLFLNEKSGCCWTQKKDCTNKYCMSRVIDRIEHEIDSANSIICIAMYMFTNQRFCDAVIRAQKRGVIVRIIMDYSQRGATGSKLKDFEKSGVAVRINVEDASLMHHKFCLIDVTTNEACDSKNKHPFGGLLITGSLNWTNNVRIHWSHELQFANAQTLYNITYYIRMPKDNLIVGATVGDHIASVGMNKNWENVTVQSKVAIKTQFKQEFDRMWTDLGNRQSFVPARRQ